jgi:putative serine protease PepD
VPAKIVGTDPSSDLAVVKVDRTGLTAAEFGSSSSLRVGETVVAVGSPFGLDKTVTSGIVSALHRSSLQSQGAGSITQYTNLIQTDAPINPGNSGGALADINGRVVGINTLIQTGGAQQSAGIGFAIPIDYAKDIADQLISTGRAVHPYLGISMVTVDSTVISQLGLTAGTTGVLVQDVAVGSPADKAGLLKNDVIVSLGGVAIAAVEDAFAAIRSRKVGEKVEIVVLRGGTKTTLTATLGSDSGQ